MCSTYDLFEAITPHQGLGLWVKWNSLPFISVPIQPPPPISLHLKKKATEIPTEKFASRCPVNQATLNTSFDLGWGTSVWVKSGTVVGNDPILSKVRTGLLASHRGSCSGRDTDGRPVSQLLFTVSLIHSK
jgi:hypothetical protein